MGAAPDSSSLATNDWNSCQSVIPPPSILMRFISSCTVSRVWGMPESAAERVKLNNL